MDELWDRLREATDNDEALVAFLQQLLTLDPEPRSDFTKLVEGHSYLQPPHVPAPISPAPTASGVPGPLADVATSSTPLHVARDGPNLPTGVAEPIPGLPSVWWDPQLPPVCELTSGSVFRYPAVV